MSVINVIPELMVEDVGKSVKFYRKYLGFELEMRVPKEGEMLWAQVRAGKNRIMFYVREEYEKEIPLLKGKLIGGTVELYIKVDKIEDIYNKMKNKVKIIQKLHETPYGAKEFVILDNSGYLVGLAQNV